MAGAVQPAPEEAPRQTPWRWFGDFLNKELSPYPGRGWTVARITIAATIVMIWIMVFRIPNAALGAYYTLLFSRDSARATVRSVIRSVSAVGASLLYITLTVRLFEAEPFLHFMWVAGTLFITFFLISALSEYAAGTAFGFLAVTSIAAWDFPANTGVLFENTLWTALAVLVGGAVTVAVELTARSIHASDEFTDRLLDRMKAVEEALWCFANDCPVEQSPRQRLEQYAMVGTASLRQLLARSLRSSQNIAEMSATVALTGRLVDLTAHVVARNEKFPEAERPGFRQAATQLAQVRSAMRDKNTRAIAEMNTNCEGAAPGSFLADIQTTIERFPEVYFGQQPLTEFLPSALDFDRPKWLFKDDAFTSDDHIHFALKGTLAALACYFLYNSVEWRGLSSSIATCMITALSTVGSSRQKQILRVAGAVLGGLVLGMTSQILLLPNMDGIGEFTLLFAAVTATSAWIGTASPLLSYAGVQTGFAFYVTQLRVFGPQTSLVVARDDVMGILFGLFAMWMIFDRIWVKDTAQDLMNMLVGNMRRIAYFDQAVNMGDLRSTIDRARHERALVNATFDQIREIGGSLVFEFGAGWRRKIEMRDQVRRWDPQLRTYFLLQVAFLHHRLQSGNRALGPEAEQNVRRSDEILSLLADLEDSKKQDEASRVRQLIHERVKQFDDEGKQESEEALPRSQPIRLSRSMLVVAVSLAKEMSRP
ncbi:MAG: Fusaric acid resistance protein conserved region [Bryobacterales bacterium]|nr:Fusaric acid resistance protein conserved region [Bryobacterales bacterium]